MKSLALLASIAIFGGTFLVDEAPKYDKNWRPYISTGLALEIVKYDNRVVPTPDETEDGCDGSGWITHGDGHRTPCPGCGKCNPNKTSAVLGYEYKLYFFTADWCGYCKKMKRDTWDNEKVIKELEKIGVQIYTFDRDNAFHKKFFDYYNVKLMPTILIFKDGELVKPVVKSEGYKGPEELLKILKGLK